MLLIVSVSTNKYKCSRAVKRVYLRHGVAGRARSIRATKLAAFGGSRSRKIAQSFDVEVSCAYVRDPCDHNERRLLRLVITAGYETSFACTSVDRFVAENPPTDSHSHRKQTVLNR